MNSLLDKEQIVSARLQEHVFSTRIDSDKVFLVVLSDVHEGMNHRDYFRDIIKFILSIPNCYVILGGDSINATGKGSKGNTTEETLSGDAQIYALVEDLKPLVADNRILAIAEDGNHNGRIYDSVYISPNKMIAVLLGIPTLYTGDMCLGFINVNKVCYTISVIHKNKKTQNYYEFARTDLLYREHWHILKSEPKLCYEWNKYSKSVSAISTYDIYNGSFLNVPAYGMKSGYRPQFMGTFFTELDGTKRRIQPWLDNDLYHAISNGYKV